MRRLFLIIVSLVLLGGSVANAAALTNSHGYLAIPTFEGSGQLLHPSIVDFQLQHGMSAWSGYRYWMVFTPFPYSGTAVDTKDPNENPSIVASNDGYTWVVPVGVTNPLHQPTGGGSATHYDNDPELVYDPVEDCLRIYFNETDTVAKYHKFQLLKVYPSMLVSSLQVLSTFTWTGTSWAGNANGLIVAPGIVREDATHWHLWGVRDNGDGTFSSVYRFSSDGYAWGTVQACNDVFTSGISGFSSWPWHFEARYNPEKNRVDILACVRSKSLFSNLQLAVVSTTFSSPTTLAQPAGLEGLILHSSVSGWDSRRLYRSAFTVTGDTYRIWYSGSQGTTDDNEVWHVGYSDSSGYDPTLSSPTVSRLSPSRGGHKLKLTRGGQRLVVKR